MGEGSFTRFIYGKLVEVRRQAGNFEIGQADVTEKLHLLQMIVQSASKSSVGY